MTINELIIDMVRVGMISLVSSKIAKAIGEKDISEIIAGAGWCVIGVDTVYILIPVVDGLRKIGENMQNFFSTFDSITKNLSDVPGLIGWFIKRGMVN